jgi:hypothetical protein
MVIFLKLHKNYLNHLGCPRTYDYVRCGTPKPNNRGLTIHSLIIIFPITKYQKYYVTYRNCKNSY